MTRLVGQVEWNELNKVISDDMSYKHWLQKTKKFHYSFRIFMTKTLLARDIKYHGT